MPGAAKPIALSLPDARRTWLAAQRLDTEAPFGEGPDSTRAAVEHLGYVQIDTINVIERCHHHILYTRIPAYRRADLRHAQAVEKSVFEYWTHALSYVPTRDLRHFLAAMRRHRREGHAWFGSVSAADIRKVMRLLREGPLSIRDIDDDVLVDKNHPWASRKPSKAALQFAFFMGRVAVSERSGMLKTYDLIERHFDWDEAPKAASERDTVTYLLDRALRAQGIVSVDSICYGDNKRKAAMRSLIAARVRKKELSPVTIDGAGRQEHWARPQTLAALPNPGVEPVHILSPFDPLVIQRKRLKLLFGYDHVFEAYVPKAKRRYGYFALPVLVGDRIVAVLDLKTDRAAGRLLVQQWTWVEGSESRPLKQRIEEELGRFERFQLAG